MDQKSEEDGSKTRPAKPVNPSKTGSETQSPKPPNVKPPAPPTAAPDQRQTQSDPGVQKDKGKPKTKPQDDKVSDEEFHHFLVASTIRLDRDRQLVLAKALAGVVGGHLSFPEAREDRVRKELREQFAGKTSGPKTDSPKEKKVQEKKEQKAKGSAKQTPTKLNAALRQTDEHKQLVSAQEALRAKRVELGVSKGTSDPRLEELVGKLEKAKADLFEKRDRLKQTQ